MKTPRETVIPTRIDEIQDFPSLKDYLKKLIEHFEDEHINIYEDLKKINQGIQVKIGSFTCPAATGNYSVTGVGFKPRYVEFMWTPTAYPTGIYLGSGWVDYNGNQGTIGCGYETSSSAYTSNRSDACIFNPNQSGVIILKASYVSMDSDGFTIIFSNVDTYFKLYWKAVR